MVLTVQPYSTVDDRTVYDGTRELCCLLVTSSITQDVELHVGGVLVETKAFTANKADWLCWLWGFTAPDVPDGLYDLVVKGVTAGEWRGKGARTSTQYSISFVDENGSPVDVDANYINLDNPSLIRRKLRKGSVFKTYTLAGRWLLEVGCKGSESAFRYKPITLTTIIGDTNVTLPLLSEAYVGIQIDLGLMGGAIVRAAMSLDWAVGSVLQQLGLTKYPSCTAYVINYLFNTTVIPPYGWEVKDNILTIYYKITPAFFGLAPLIIAIIILAIIVAVPISIYGVSLIAHEVTEKARTEAQKTIATEQTSAIKEWMDYATTAGLTSEQTTRGLEAITGSYKQMSQNLEPTPTPAPTPWTTYLVVGAIAIVGVGALLWFLTKR